MKTFDSFLYRLPLFLFALVLLCLIAPAHAQSAGTRVTPCDAATPNDAICIKITHDGKANGGTTTAPGVVFRVQKKTGATGSYVDVATAITGPLYYAKNLSLGTHYFTAYASCPTCTAQSDASNEVNGTATATPIVPSAPVLIIAATIRADGPPVYRIIQSVTLKPNEVVFSAPAAMRPLFASR